MDNPMQRYKKPLEDIFEKVRLFRDIGKENELTKRVLDAVERLPIKERLLIEARYLQDDYVYDRDVYSLRLNPPVSFGTYKKIRLSAFRKLYEQLVEEGDLQIETKSNAFQSPQLRIEENSTLPYEMFAKLFTEFAKAKFGLNLKVEVVNNEVS